MKKSLLIIILLLVSVVNIVRVSPVYGQVYTTLKVDPPCIIDTTKTAGTTFTININILDVTDLALYEFFLNYTTAVLTATEITLGPFFPPDSMIWHEEINDTLGYVRYAVGMPFGVIVGKSGSGTLATISFTVDSIGETPLELCNTELIDLEGELIGHDIVDAYFSNIPRPGLYVNPDNIINPDLVSGESFTINVNILDVTDLFGYEFRLNYTTAVLTATEITLGPFFPPDSMIWHEEINDTLGYVRYAVGMPFGVIVGKSGSGTLATISFTVDSIGETPLELCNTELIDSEEQRIEHDTVPGYFNNKPVIRDIAITNVTTTITTVKVEQNVTVPEVKPVSEVHAGEKVNITVYVKNNGTVTEDFSVTAYYDNNTIGTKNVTDLSKSFLIPLIFEWNTEGVVTGSYTIWAEASVVPGETYTANNKFTKEGEFEVLPGGHSFFTELAVAAIVVIIIAAIAVYFIKIRKPKPA